MYEPKDAVEFWVMFIFFMAAALVFYAGTQGVFDR